MHKFNRLINYKKNLINFHTANSKGPFFTIIIEHFLLWFFRAHINVHKFFKYILLEPGLYNYNIISELTVNGQYVRLCYFRVSQGSARVIPGVDQLNFSEV